MKVVLIVIDGMRPDALDGMSVADRLKQMSTYSLNGVTVMRSSTLPAHMSLFHSVDPTRHGTATNTFMPQVRPIDGLCEVLFKNAKYNAFFYSWSQLRDLTRPGMLKYSVYCKGAMLGYEKVDKILTDTALDCLQGDDVDFTFLYLEGPDESGHKYGWMSEEYLRAVEYDIDLALRVIDTLPKDEYTVIVTADHGGHDRTHGTEIKEDMTIPAFFIGKDFASGKEILTMSIKDIAPTVTELLSVQANEEWEGNSLLNI